MGSHTTSEDNEALQRRRPRIVHRGEDPSVTPPESDNPDYDYFAYAAKDQLPDLNAMIVEREKKLFEVRASLLMLTDNPSTNPGMISHDAFAAMMANQKIAAEKNGEKWVQQQVCPCVACELLRLHDAEAGLVFGLNKLRGLYAQLAGGK